MINSLPWRIILSARAHRKVFRNFSYFNKVIFDNKNSIYFGSFVGDGYSSITIFDYVLGVEIISGLFSSWFSSCFYCSPKGFLSFLNSSSFSLSPSKFTVLLSRSRDGILREKLSTSADSY